MATTYTNNWKNIIDKLIDVLSSEFGGALPVYRGHDNKKIANQYLQLNPTGSDLIEYTVKQEIREFSIQILYYLLDSNIKEPTLDYIMNTISRVESLIHDNTTMTYSWVNPDNHTMTTEYAYNCRVESMEMNTGEDDNEYVVQWEWKCLHRTNLA